MKNSLILSSLFVLLVSCNGGGNANPFESTTEVDPAAPSMTLNQSAYSLSRGDLVNIKPITANITECEISADVPTGLTFDAQNCELTGTLANNNITRTYSFAIKDVNSNKSVSASIQVQALLLNASSFTTARSSVVNQSITTSIAVTCSKEASQSLPAGLTLNSNCTITGTPSVSGSTEFTLDLNVGATKIQSLTYAITVTQPAPILNAGVNSISRVFKSSAGLTLKVYADSILSSNGCTLSGNTTGLSVSMKEESGVSYCEIVASTSTFGQTTKAGRDLTLTGSNMYGTSNSVTLNLKAYRHHCEQTLSGDSTLVSAGFDGTSASRPIIICATQAGARTLAQLSGDTTGKFFKLQEDLDVAVNSQNAFVANDFKGQFDGAGFAFKNSTTAMPNFVSTAGNAVIKNLQVDNLVMNVTSAAGHVGLIAGTVKANSTLSLENIYISNSTLSNESVMTSGVYVGFVSNNSSVNINNSVVFNMVLPASSSQSGCSVGVGSKTVLDVVAKTYTNCTDSAGITMANFINVESPLQSMYYNFDSSDWSLVNGNYPALVKKLDRVYSNGVDVFGEDF